MILYLVVNRENEPIILNICKTLEMAKTLAETYESNFKKNLNKEGIIAIEDIDVSLNNEVIWSMYPINMMAPDIYND